MLYRFHIWLQIGKHQQRETKPKKTEERKKAKLRKSLNNRDRCSTHVQTPRNERWHIRMLYRFYIWLQIGKQQQRETKPKRTEERKKAKLRSSLNNKDRCSTHVQTPGLQSTMQRTARCWRNKIAEEHSLIQTFQGLQANSWEIPGLSQPAKTLGIAIQRTFNRQQHLLVLLLSSERHAGILCLLGGLHDLLAQNPAIVRCTISAWNLQKRNING